MYRNQLSCKFKLLYSKLQKPRYSDQKDVHVLGELAVKFPLRSFGTDRPVKFFLKFAEEELKVTARNVLTNEVYSATFSYPTSYY